MKPERVRLLLVFALLFILFGTLTLFFWDFVRESIAIPIYYLLWVGNLTLKSIPQEIYLGVLIIVCVLIALNTLRSVRVRPTEARAVENRQSTTSRYVLWRRIINNLTISEFSREQFVQEARKMILAILAYQYDVTPAQVEEMVKDGKIVLPEAITSLLQRQALQVTGQAPTTFKNTLRQWRDRLLGKPPQRDPHLDQQVEEVIQFIEQQLELTHARQ